MLFLQSYFYLLIITNLQIAFISSVFLFGTLLAIHRQNRFSTGDFYNIRNPSQIHMELEVLLNLHLPIIIFSPLQLHCHALFKTTERLDNRYRYYKRQVCLRFEFIFQTDWLYCNDPPIPIWLLRTQGHGMGGARNVFDNISRHAIKFGGKHIALE